MMRLTINLDNGSDHFIKDKMCFNNTNNNNNNNNDDDDDNNNNNDNKTLVMYIICALLGFHLCHFKGHNCV